MQIVSEIAFIRYAEQSVCIISRNCCRSSIKGFNQKCIFMHRHDQAAFCSFFESKADIRNPSLQLCWQGLASLLAHEHSRFAICQWDLSTPTDISIPLTRRLVLRALEAGECLSAFKIAKLICCSSPTAVEIISLRYHFKVHTVLILCFSSNIIDLSIFIDVHSCFLSIYWFSIVLLFGCIPLLLISSPSNLAWLNPYISNHCNTLSSSQSDIRNPSLQFCWQGLASLLVHERSHFSPCQRELSTATDISIHPLLSVLHV